MRTSQSGFTVIELIVVIGMAFFVAFLFIVQKDDMVAHDRDAASKQDINSIYYYLEGVSYPAAGGYPATLDEKQLTGLDPQVLKDDTGKKISDKDSAYTYEAIGCQNNLCSSYKLTAKLQKEADFTKISPQRTGGN